MAGTHRNQCRCGSMGQKAQSLALASARAGRSLFLRLCFSSFSQEWWAMPCRTPKLVHAAVLFYFKVTDVCVLFPKENLRHCWFFCCCCSLLFSIFIWFVLVKQWTTSALPVVRWKCSWNVWPGTGKRSMHLERLRSQGNCLPTAWRCPHIFFLDFGSHCLVSPCVPVRQTWPRTFHKAPPGCSAWTLLT